jgi:hypothetical protein
LVIFLLLPLQNRRPYLVVVCPSRHIIFFLSWISLCILVSDVELPAALRGNYLENVRWFPS